MHKNKFSLANRFRYLFDRTLSRGPLALGIWLGLLSILIVILATLIIFLWRSNPYANLPELFYSILLQALVPNPVDPTSGRWLYLIVMLVVSVGGLLIFSIFIGIFTTTIEDRIQLLRKGRSLVLEKDHTVILGWSTQIFAIIDELVTAYASQPGLCIAILAEKDKLEMEDEIRSRVGKLRNTRIVCRTGSPMDQNDLEIVSVETARAIIVLATNFQYHDAEVIKTVLAITQSPDRRPEPYHIVGSLRNPASQEIATMIVQAGEAILFQVDTLISRITAQSCRQTGLSVVYEELLDFKGGRIYFKPIPELTGKTFGEALFVFEDAALIGLVTAQGVVQLKPPLGERLQAGEQLIVISSSELAIHAAQPQDMQLDPQSIYLTPPNERSPERTLILGWNQRASLIIKNLDAYVLPGSSIQVIADEDIIREEIHLLAAELSNQTVSFKSANIVSRAFLESLDFEIYDHIILLSYSPDQDVQHADSRTMMTLLHLRDIADKRSSHLSIVSEIIDIRNRQLIEIARVDDFIISDVLTSRSLAQLSVDRKILNIFLDLFNPVGSEIYLKPIEFYLQLERPVNFYTALEAARLRDEVAIGYRLEAEARSPEENYGIHLNPKKSELIRFSHGDRLIVLAEKQ